MGDLDDKTGIMLEFETAIQKAIDDGVIAGAAVAVANKNSDGPAYLKAFGSTDIKEGASPMQPDSMIWVASCTKLMTAVAAMQCVERGLLDLDADISGVLPEWKNPQILTGFDSASGEPILKPASKRPNLRQLLTHSSGMTYDQMNPLLTQYREHQKSPIRQVNDSIADDYARLLVYEPGEGWEYSCSIDWAGKMVERANGGVRLGEYLAENIWKPLGMSSTTFRPLGRPELMERMVARFMRQADGKLGPDAMGWFPIIEPTDDSGGSGSFTCAPDYIKMLTSLLRDDGKLLKSSTLEELFKPQLPDPKYLKAQTEHPYYGRFLTPGAPPGMQWNYALGGIIAINGMPGRLNKGTMMWSGLPNSHWYIDRERGLAGFYGSQLFPPDDEPTSALNAEFQKVAHQSEL